MDKAQRIQERERLRAAAQGQREWGRSGSVDQARYAVPVDSHRRCMCGNRVTHSGMANGLALCGGCEMCVRRWVREGSSAWINLAEEMDRKRAQCAHRHLHATKLPALLKRVGYRLVKCDCGLRRATKPGSS